MHPSPATDTDRAATVEDDGAPGLRERKKLETRQALADAAIALFARRGFDETTVEDVAAEVDVSPRTFHRYFPRKEDAVFADSAARLDRFRARLADAPGTTTVLTAVRRAAAETAAEYAESTERERARSRLVSSTPALRAYNLGRYDEWASAIAAYAAAAAGEAPTDRWPALFGACAMAALTTATRRWANDTSLDLAEEYDAVLGLLAGLDRPVTRPPTTAEKAPR